MFFIGRLWFLHAHDGVARHRARYCCCFEIDEMSDLNMHTNNKWALILNVKKRLNRNTAAQWEQATETEHCQQPISALMMRLIKRN